MVSSLRQLLRNEFAFEGYMDQGEEDLEMGEFYTMTTIHMHVSPSANETGFCPSYSPVHGVTAFTCAGIPPLV